MLGIGPGTERCLVSVQPRELTQPPSCNKALCLLGKRAVRAVRLILWLLELASVIVSTAPVDIGVTGQHSTRGHWSYLCFGTLLNPILTAWDNSLCQYSVTLKSTDTLSSDLNKQWNL